MQQQFLNTKGQEIEFPKILRKQDNPRKSLTPAIHHPLTLLRFAAPFARPSVWFCVVVLVSLLLCSSWFVLQFPFLAVLFVLLSALFSLCLDLSFVAGLCLVVVWSCLLFHYPLASQTPLSRRSNAAFPQIKQPLTGYAQSTNEEPITTRTSPLTHPHYHVLGMTFVPGRYIPEPSKCRVLCSRGGGDTKWFTKCLELLVLVVVSVPD